MRNTKLITSLTTWALGIGSFILSIIFSPLLHKIFKNIGIPTFLISLIFCTFFLIILLEVVIKFLFLKIAITPTKFIPTQVESWSNLDKDKLNDYTRELEILGFVHLTDYTSPGAQGMGRLFVQPHKFCFAEVGQVGEQPMFCSISCSLSKQWTLGVTNLRVNPNLDAISYAFLRQPRVLVKRFNNETPDTLLQSLLEWRQQALVKLKVEMQQNTTAEAYFEREHQRRILQRQSVFRKSIIWGLLEMLWYSYNPMSEWLGDYNKSNIN